MRKGQKGKRTASSGTHESRRSEYSYQEVADAIRGEGGPSAAGGLTCRTGLTIGSRPERALN